MNWYYSDGNKAVGPLAEATMMELRACGMLTDATQVAKEGADEWTNYADAFKDAVKLPPVPPKQKGPSLVVNTWSRVTDGVSSATGLEKLEGHGAKSLFGALFSKRTIEEIEDSFAVGTANTTPTLKNVSADWPAPWVFMRLLSFSIVVTIGFYWALQRFDNIKLYPGWLFMGAFAVPISVMFFFVETNVLRNISLYRVLKLFFFGGLISLIFALFLFEMTAAAEWFGAMSAGPVEELAKLLAVAFVAKQWKNMHWTLNGMLLGAAVGAGFAAFETAGYIFEYAIKDGSDIQVMLLRAMTTPFTHIIYTACTAGALWRFKGERDFDFSMLKEWPVLRILLFVMALHAIWNSPLSVPLFGGLSGILLKSLILGVIGWLLVLMLIQSGLAQVKKAQEAANPITPQPIEP
jgi:RsiW-degrading membrane proteinase PrsW (M82 family)